MCVIAVSSVGARQPSEKELTAMFRANPDGAGYMFARHGLVYIHKGFMNMRDYLAAIRNERFSTGDAVIYHCRIASAGSICPQNTHPYPLTAKRNYHRALDLSCSCGIAHNGTINFLREHLDGQTDTSCFITDYLVKIIQKDADLLDPAIQEIISALTWSKFAILLGDGTTATIGNFTNVNGILVSNTYYMNPAPRYYISSRNYSLQPEV